ncbi:MAG: hypothetical protein HDQ93_02415 [Desulfovibrio sp.]|nr:hypothetical protein [Desulfovibrio sp.]
MAKFVVNRGLLLAVAIVAATVFLTLEFYGPRMLIVPGYVFGISAFVIWKFYGPDEYKNGKKSPDTASEQESATSIKYSPAESGIGRALERARKANALSRNNPPGKIAEEDSLWLLYDGSEDDTREEYEAKLAIARKQFREINERLKLEDRKRRMKERERRKTPY